MRTILRTTALAAVLVVGVGALGGCSSDDGAEAEATTATTTEAPAPTTTEAPAPTTIEATGTLLNGPPGTGSVSRLPDGSEVGTSQQEMQGDLAGTLDSEWHILVDYANAPPLTFTVFEATYTFTGTIEGVGSGTLTFTTSAPSNIYDQNTATVESGTAGDGTGDLAGYEGTIEMAYTLLFGGAIKDGTYTVNLEYVG
jgi:hypothetical protein